MLPVYSRGSNDTLGDTPALVNSWEHDLFEETKEDEGG